MGFADTAFAADDDDANTKHLGTGTSIMQEKRKYEKIPTFIKKEWKQNLELSLSQLWIFLLQSPASHHFTPGSQVVKVLAIYLYHHHRHHPTDLFFFYLSLSPPNLQDFLSSFTLLIYFSLLFMPLWIGWVEEDETLVLAWHGMTWERWSEMKKEYLFRFNFPFPFPSPSTSTWSRSRSGSHQDPDRDLFKVRLPQSRFFDQTKGHPK